MRNRIQDLQLRALLEVRPPPWRPEAPSRQVVENTSRWAALALRATSDLGIGRTPTDDRKKGGLVYVSYWRQDKSFAAHLVKPEQSVDQEGVHSRDGAARTFCRQPRASAGGTSETGSTAQSRAGGKEQA